MLISLLHCGNLCEASRGVSTTPGTTLARLRLIFGSVAPRPHCPFSPREVTRATKSGIDYEDRAVCRSPRSEASPSAFCSGGDGHYADREFDLDDFVLTAPLTQTAKPSALRAANGFALSPEVSRGHTASVGVGRWSGPPLVRPLVSIRPEQWCLKQRPRA
jgi:hypothetical protein